MFLDPDKRKVWDKRIMEFEVLDMPTSNSDIIYTTIEFPMPLSNRDLLQVRHFVDNKKDEDLIKKYGLPEKSHHYFFQVNKSCTRKDCPDKKGFVRADMQKAGWIAEEIPDKPGYISYKSLMQQDIKGSAPTFLVTKFAKGVCLKGMTGFLEGYKKL